MTTETPADHSKQGSGCTTQTEVTVSLTFECGKFWVGAYLLDLSYENAQIAMAVGPTLSTFDGEMFIHLHGQPPRSINYGNSYSVEMGNFGCWPEIGNRSSIDIRMDSEMELADFLRVAHDLSLFKLTYYDIRECEVTKTPYSKTVVGL